MAKKKKIMISYTAYKNILNLVQEVQEYSTHIRMIFILQTFITVYERVSAPDEDW